MERVCVHLQFEGVCVVGTRGEVGVSQRSAAERPAVRQLVLLAVLRLDALSVAVGGVGGAHRLATYTPRRQRRGLKTEPQQVAC